MTLEVFMLILSAVSIITAFTVEGLKKLIGDKFNYSANVLAGIVATVLGVIVSVCYCVFFGIPITAPIVVSIFALAFLSWLSSMLGYDKVVQLITQLKNLKK